MRFSTIKQLIKDCTPPIVEGILRSMKKRWEIRLYLRRGKIPWTPGYDTYKRELISQALINESLLARFRSGGSLPHGYGIGVDERCVEYPWLISHLQNKVETFLDAGSALNHDFILSHPIFQTKAMHILTLSPEKNCFWTEGISYLYHDLRNSPIRDMYYDSIVCLSTLEHVGFDNTHYTNDTIAKESHPRDFMVVMQELNRMLKPGGTLYLTVPFGTYHNYGTFQQFDKELLFLAINAFGRADEIDSAFYRYTVNGWDIGSMDGCDEINYVEWVIKPRDQWIAPIMVESDFAAAARAVACVRIIKPRSP